MLEGEKNLVPLGIGIGVGVLSLYTMIELFPFLIIGGAGYLVMQGLKNKNRSNECQENGPSKK